MGPLKTQALFRATPGGTASPGPIGSGGITPPSLRYSNTQLTCYANALFQALATKLLNVATGPLLEVVTPSTEVKNPNSYVGSVWSHFGLDQMLGYEQDFTDFLLKMVKKEKLFSLFPTFGNCSKCNQHLFSVTDSVTNLFPHLEYVQFQEAMCTSCDSGSHMVANPTPSIPSALRILRSYNQRDGFASRDLMQCRHLTIGGHPYRMYGLIIFQTLPSPHYFYVEISKHIVVHNDIQKISFPSEEQLYDYLNAKSCIVLGICMELIVEHPPPVPAVVSPVVQREQDDSSDNKLLELLQVMQTNWNKGPDSMQLIYDCATKVLPLSNSFMYGKPDKKLNEFLETFINVCFQYSELQPIIDKFRLNRKQNNINLVKKLSKNHPKFKSFIDKLKCSFCVEPAAKRPCLDVDVAGNHSGVEVSTPDTQIEPLLDLLSMLCENWDHSKKAMHTIYTKAAPLLGLPHNFMKSALEEKRSKFLEHFMEVLNRHFDFASVIARYRTKKTQKDATVFKVLSNDLEQFKVLLVEVKSILSKKICPNNCVAIEPSVASIVVEPKVVPRTSVRIEQQDVV